MVTVNIVTLRDRNIRPEFPGCENRGRPTLLQASAWGQGQAAERSGKSRRTTSLIEEESKCPGLGAAQPGNSATGRAP